MCRKTSQWAGRSAVTGEIPGSPPDGNRQQRPSAVPGLPRKTRSLALGNRKPARFWTVRLGQGRGCACRRFIGAPVTQLRGIKQPTCNISVIGGCGFAPVPGCGPGGQADAGIRRRPGKAANPNGGSFLGPGREAAGRGWKACLLQWEGSGSPWIQERLRMFQRWTVPMGIGARDACRGIAADSSLPWLPGSRHHEVAPGRRSATGSLHVKGWRLEQRRRALRSVQQPRLAG